ncbi:MAG: hypothetical protein PWQ57_2898 [Desulfovibrionales bacterium]|jgi:hypothetical protein|nr:hypothetical protein [Desulfovibrionales bacterium]
MRGAVNEPAEYDLKSMVCGLMPEIGRLLREARTNEVRMRLHKGVERELASVFGAGGDWDYEVFPETDCDLAVFRRRRKAKSNPLNLF